MEMSEIRQEGLRNNKKIHNAVTTILKELGEDPTREGLERTPFRVAKACEEWFGGYGKSPEKILNRTFTGGSELVIEGPIAFYSHCEHHITPFNGEVWIGYIPSQWVTGLDKLVKLTEVYARRLQIQERLTTQIADVLEEYLECQGVMVVVRATHHCVCSRETRNYTTKTITSAVRGGFKNDVNARQEFLKLIGL